jgi:hypothetical protein
MSKQLTLVTLLVIIMCTANNAKFLQSSILSEDYFNLSSKCVMPMLAETLADFQISKKSHVTAIIDIQKNFDAMGVPNNKDTNPENVKSIMVVYRLDLQKVGLFWIDNNDKQILTPPTSGIMEISTACIIWLKDIVNISNKYEISSDAPLVKDEATFGNHKYTYHDQKEQIEYGYIFQDSKLTALTQVRDPDFGLLANLIAFIEESKVLKAQDFIPIPEGIKYQEL